LTAASIGAAKAGGYARYLEAKTIEPERGDYYLSATGEPTQAPGRWLASPDTLARLGIEGQSVDGRDFIALMEGKHPRSGAWLRPEGAGGGRGGGVDLTFSAPKSVSVLWALGDEQSRGEIEAAHAAAVEQAMGHLRESVATVRRSGGRIEEPAADLIAAEYRHTTARAVLDGEAPDPQLHSHVVVTSAVREDGRIVAVASRPVFRAAREVGAYYRSALAQELRLRGHVIERATGKEGRFFEVAGVPRSVIESFSARGREVARAIERFRAERGRVPEVGELQVLKLESRRAKVVVTKADLRRSWSETAARHDFDVDRLVHDERPQSPQLPLEDRIEERLTDRAATFPASELRAIALEQSTGELSPQQAMTLTRTMMAERRVLPLQGGLMTTLTVRAREQAIERRFAELAKAAGRDVGEPARTRAAAQVRERIGAPLSDKQLSALRAISGPERGAVLVGPAGTGKSVVIDAAACAEQLTGGEVFGVAVAGATAQRLGRDSPAFAGRTLTLDALVSRAERGTLALGRRTTVYFDEAGMADTARLDHLTELIADRGAKLVVIGDAAQLPSIGAGGMFARLEEIAPSAELSNIRRTLDPAEQRAWADLRAGRSERAMACYLAQGRLHFSDDRDEAVEHAVREWAKLTERHPIEQVALISDASNKEIDRMNARAQHHRTARSELGDVEVQVPGVHYGLHEGDRVALIAQHRQEGMARIENGERGEVLAIGRGGEVLIEFDSGELRSFVGEDLARVRLGYAQHIHRAQGATVTRTLVVTGGWQTSKESSYVEASRARRGTDWFLAREDLGVEGQDSERIARLAQRMSDSRAQMPSLAYAELPDPRNGPGFRDPVEHARAIPPGIARVLHRLARTVAQPERTR
jgi:conjugative relaxase-like TrwC/TraI family protein